jgi:DNA-binding LacI/PurR family transcriptional regulator
VVALADPLPLLPSVAVDDAEGSRLLADHLAGRGHRRVLYRMSPRRHTSVERRLAAFRAAASAHKMTITESRSLDYSGRLAAEESACLALPAGERPTAVACSNDFLAFHLLDSCRSLGLRVPDDLAVAGFDGVASSLGPGLRLTSIRAPWVEVAQTAVSLLVSRIDGREIPTETVLPVELVVGDTT